MQPDFNPVTKQGYQKIETEIEALKQERPTKIAALVAARALGDLSENADYSAAKRDLRHLESRLRFLDKQLRYAKIIEPNDNAVVEIGKTVTLAFQDDDSEDTFAIVGTPEANIADNKVSIASPMGKALLNHTVNDVVTISSPNGHYAVKLLAVSITE